MKLQSLLLSIALSCCCAEGDRHDTPPAAVVTGAAQSPVQSDAGLAPKLAEQVQDQQLWRKEVLDLLSQLVQVQREVAGGQGQVVQLLGTLGTQGSQQNQHLQTLARHQSLLVENHQALLLQTSRIATHLQDLKKSPNAAPSQ